MFVLRLEAAFACVAVGLAAEIERYADRYRRNPHAIRAPLSSVLKLTPKHFPAELLGPGKHSEHWLVSSLNFLSTLRFLYRRVHGLS